MSWFSSRDLDRDMGCCGFLGVLFRRKSNEWEPLPDDDGYGAPYYGEVNRFMPDENRAICREHPVKVTTLLVKTEDESGKKMINEYVRDFTIGRGSYGKVVLYRSTVDGKQYAFKAFYKSRLTRIRVASNETAMTDVLREIAIMKLLEHPNIVNLIEVIDDPNSDKFYMVLEYVEGKSIAAALENLGVLDEITCRQYMRDIVAGLIYLHDHGIFHGDIKPENLLVTGNGSVKIGDFGVSHIFEDGKDELCRSPGTPVFTAPECCYGSSYHGKPADVWAVGITLYCMILGCCPFIGDSLQDTYDMIVTKSLNIPGNVDHDLKDLLQGLLCKEPKLRLTLDEVSKHPWLVKDLGPLARTVCRCRSGNLQAQNQAANNVNGT